MSSFTPDNQVFANYAVADTKIVSNKLSQNETVLNSGSDFTISAKAALLPLLGKKEVAASPLLKSKSSGPTVAASVHFFVVIVEPVAVVWFMKRPLRNW